MPTKVVQEFQNRSWWHEKGSVEYIYIKKRKNKEMSDQHNIEKNPSKL